MPAVSVFAPPIVRAKIAAKIMTVVLLAKPALAKPDLVAPVDVLRVTLSLVV